MIKLSNFCLMEEGIVAGLCKRIEELELVD